VRKKEDEGHARPPAMSKRARGRPVNVGHGKEEARMGRRRMEK